MNTTQAYNQWASIYDTNLNATRDLEAIAIKQVLGQYSFENLLEMGCGTGKNTLFLSTIAGQVLSIDNSTEMLAVAFKKIKANNVTFKPIDINEDWNFTSIKKDAICFSLILEHFENIEILLTKAKNSLNKDGLIYIGELHPYKQYEGSVAKFTTNDVEHKLVSHTHSISSYINILRKLNFNIINLAEWHTNENDKTPRILTIIAQLKNN